MRFQTSLLKFLLIVPFGTGSSEPCPIYGPVFPSPTNLDTSKSFREALSNLSSSISDALATGNSTHGPVSSNDTYAIQVFSTSDDTPLLEYYNSGQNLVNSTVDGDSVFRIGSVSKLYAVYLLLIEAGENVMNDPVTKYMPELEGKQYWDQITVGSLSSHLGGFAADGMLNHLI
jgi:hypothetical protein